MFESLDEVYDARWIKRFELAAEKIKESLAKTPRNEFKGGFIPSCSCRRRYK